MARKTVEEVKSSRGVQVSTTLPKNMAEALEDHRWTVRKTMTELVRAALDEYAANHDISVAPEDEGNESA